MKYSQSVITMRYVEALVTTIDSITKGNIYEVIEYDHYDDYVKIINDKRELRGYYMSYRSGPWFKDGAIKMRTNTIEEILL